MLKNYCIIAGVQDVLIGMPHRGRLNLLCDLLEYPHAALFSKMKGNSELPSDTVHSGDVISHLSNVSFFIYMLYYFQCIAHRHTHIYV